MVPVPVIEIIKIITLTKPKGMLMLISLMLRTNYVIRVMRVKDKGDKDNFK